MKGKIRDKDGGVSEYAGSVTVSNVAPTAAFGDNGPVDEGSSFTLSLTNPSDPGPDAPYQYAFDCGDGSGYGSFSSSNTVNCPTSDNGARAVKGKIRDKDGGVSEYAGSVTVSNVAPTAAFGDNGPVDEGSSFTLSLTNPSDPGPDAPYQYAFDCGDGSGYGSFSSSNTVNCPTSDNGARAVKGKIRDKDGGVSEYAASVTVDNVAPTVEAGPDQNAFQGNPFALTTPTFTDPGASDAHTATIDWGDGNVSAGAVSGRTVSGQHAYNRGGDYAVTVCVQDDDGGRGCDTLMIAVSSVLRFRGHVYEGPQNDHSQPLQGVALSLYGRNEGQSEPGDLIREETTNAAGFFNFYLIAPWTDYAEFTLMAQAPEGMTPIAVWSEDGEVVDMTTIRWAAPATEVHENIFTFETPTTPPAEPITETVELPLLNDAWVTWGQPDANYDGWAGLSVWTTGLDNALLKFDRSPLPQNATVISATLTVNVQGQTGAGGKTLAALNADPYTPAQVSYASAPATYNPSPAVDVPLAAGPLSLDVTGQVAAWDGNGLVSYQWAYLALSASGPAGRIILDSLESDSGSPPRLLVTYRYAP